MAATPDPTTPITTAPDWCAWGMPGTGKTTALLDILEDELDDPAVGVTDVAAVTFRSSMADEFAERVRDTIGNDDLPNGHWIRTTHSACYRLLDIDSENVVSDDDKKTVCEELRIPFASDGGTEDEDDDDGPRWMDLSNSSGGSALGNELFQMRSYCLNTFQDPIDDWKGVPGISPDTREAIGRSGNRLVRRFNEAYEDWKADEGAVDFDDMLLGVYEQGLCPPVRVLIEDEFQDKSPLQLAIYSQWAEHTNRVYVAGDVFQAVYGFLGAAPEHMTDVIDNADESVTLDTSYRFGRDVWRFATTILGEAGYDVPDIEPTGTSTVSRMSWTDYRRTVGQIPDEDTLHLVRANYKADDVAQVLQDAGVPFGSTGGGRRWTERMIGLYNAAATLTDAVRASTERFGSPDYSDLTRYDARYVLDALPADMFAGQKGEKVSAAKAADTDDDLKLNKWLQPGELLGLLQGPTPFDEMNKSKVGSSPEVRGRIKDAWQRRDGMPVGDLDHTITTIHGAKGREADTVFLLDTTTDRIQRQADPKDEARVWFVGATRARNNLHIVETDDHSRRRLPEVPA